MIKVENLVKEYRTTDGNFRAIDDVSFQVNKGEVFGIIGLSGAGKSTLVRCLNRLEEPTSGRIEIDGKVINNLSNEKLLVTRRNIGMIFQNFNLFNQRNVYENIAYPLEIAGFKENEINKKVLELLDFVNLTDKKASYPAELSGGQKQRVAIARALATSPKILLSDESTSALDPRTTDQILKLIKLSVKKFGMTVVMITHQMEVAKSICDRIAVMDKGKIIETGPVETIFKSPKTSVTKSFIKKLPDEAEEISLDRNATPDRMYRLNFGPETVDKPIINDLIKESNATVNILSGKISRLVNGKSSGYLTVELIGDKIEVDTTLEKIKNLDVGVEEI